MTRQSERTGPEDFDDSWHDEAHVDLELELDQHAQLKSVLRPEEDVVWAARAGMPAPPAVAGFPAFFTAVLCGLSGFALMLLFGIYGLVDLDPMQLMFCAGLAPAALGSVIGAGMVARWVRFRQACFRLSHTFYALTGDRALVATEAGWDQPASFSWLTGEMFDDTLVIEQPDGRGDMYFVKDGAVVSPQLGFVGLVRPRQVETLLRMILLELGPHSEKPGSESQKRPHSWFEASA